MQTPSLMFLCASLQHKYKIADLLMVQCRFYHSGVIVASCRYPSFALDSVQGQPKQSSNAVLQLMQLSIGRFLIQIPALKKGIEFNILHSHFPLYDSKIVIQLIWKKKCCIYILLKLSLSFLGKMVHHSATIFEPLMKANIHGSG